MYMYRKSNHTLQTFLIGTLIGGTIGATLALLYAPQKGKKLRRNISNRIDNLSGDVQTFAKRAKKTGAQLLHDGLETGDELLHGAYQNAGKLIDQAANLV